MSLQRIETDGVSKLDRRAVELGRPPLPRPDPGPHLLHSVDEQEPLDRAGRIATARTLFLRGSECRFRCAMCDLWQFTHPVGTKPGSITAQVLEGLFGRTVPYRLKLYNAANFFDPFNVPDEDLQMLPAELRNISEVVVENHPRVLPKDRILRFRDGLAGGLQVALGLEIASDNWLKVLNKQMSLRDFESATAWYGDHQISTRAFILIGLPGLSRQEAVDAALDSVRFAVQCGVSFVSLIPLRLGRGAFSPPDDTARSPCPTAGDVEQATEQALSLSASGIVTVDTWDWSHIRGTCDACRESRRTRLEQINLQQQVLPPFVCEMCG